MPVHRLLQCLDSHFPIFHLNFEIRHYAVKYLLCNPSCTLLVRQVMCHVIVEPIGIRDNDINHPLQIVEEAGQVLSAPRIIWLCIRALGVIRNNKADPLPVRNTD